MFVSTIYIISVKTINTIFKIYLSVKKNRTSHDLWGVDNYLSGTPLLNIIIV